MDPIERIKLAEKKAIEAEIEAEKRITFAKKSSLSKNTVEIKKNKLEELLNIKFTEYNNKRNLVELGLDSMKIVEVGDEIEDIIEMNLDLESLFRINLGDIYNLLDKNSKLYNQTLEKIEGFKLKEIQKLPSDEAKEGYGFCSHMHNKNIINYSEFLEIKNTQKRIINGELGCKLSDELNRFVEMSRKTVEKLKETDDYDVYFKEESKKLIKIITKNNNLENIHLNWCRFNSNIITKIDPNYSFIPNNSKDIEIIKKYL